MSSRLLLAAAVALVPAGLVMAQEPATPAAPHPAAAPVHGPGAKAKPAKPELPDSVGPVDYRREVFRYAGGSRDPFESLITSNSVGPMIGDLRLVSITYDARYGNSVAIVRATNNSRPFRVHRGDTIGRMRVIQIREYEVVFQIEEFGFERQEVLALRRPEVAR